MKLQNKSREIKLMKKIKGYKSFDIGLKCRGFQYEIGQTYKHNGKIQLCVSGFHFGKKATDCLYYRSAFESEFAEIEATGKVIEDEDKCVTNEIRIVRLISHSEFSELVNSERDRPRRP